MASAAPPFLNCRRIRGARDWLATSARNVAVHPKGLARHQRTQCSRAPYRRAATARCTNDVVNARSWRRASTRERTAKLGEHAVIERRCGRWRTSLVDPFVLGAGPLECDECDNERNLRNGRRVFLATDASRVRMRRMGGVSWLWFTYMEAE